MGKKGSAEDTIKTIRRKIHRKHGALALVDCADFAPDARQTYRFVIQCTSIYLVRDLIQPEIGVINVVAQKFERLEPLNVCWSSCKTELLNLSGN